MKVANVSTTKNTLSSILAEVKRGETYLIVDRSVPVARIEPLHAGTEKLASLVTDGVVAMPQQKIDVERFVHASKPALQEGASAAAALMADRDDRA
jgi:antitoxin (DNA-binding transcriptional repressor) of toxin-antitoxin stability system